MLTIPRPRGCNVLTFRYCENRSGGPRHLALNSPRRAVITGNGFFEGEALIVMRVPGESLDGHPYKVHMRVPLVVVVAWQFLDCGGSFCS